MYRKRLTCGPQTGRLRYEKLLDQYMGQHSLLSVPLRLNRPTKNLSINSKEEENETLWCRIA